ncbi:30226_t:CDS:2 [Racocetra persica]|uniref:30226_t:CDS:1 n=1 Tax=Racocetra persica TaxID=160502 RepID=A0ACA9KZ47_9GLOM|nr:30226_t:CDS:2 [Racocetra persica]
MPQLAIGMGHCAACACCSKFLKTAAVWFSNFKQAGPACIKLQAL